MNVSVGGAMSPIQRVIYNVLQVSSTVSWVVFRWNVHQSENKKSKKSLIHLPGRGDLESSRPASATRRHHQKFHSNLRSLNWFRFSLAESGLVVGDLGGHWTCNRRLVDRYSPLLSTDRLDQPSIDTVIGRQVVAEIKWMDSDPGSVFSLAGELGRSEPVSSRRATVFWCCYLGRRATVVWCCYLGRRVWWAGVPGWWASPGPGEGGQVVSF